MYLAINLDDFSQHFVMLSEKTKNNVMNNSDFYRLYYSDTLHNSNGLYVFFTLRNITITKYFNKLKATFNNNVNKSHILKLQSVERQILGLFSNKKKTAVYRIGEQLNNNFIKIFGEINNCNKESSFQIILKVSGIWSDVNEFGLTFRFYIVNRLL